MLILHRMHNGEYFNDPTRSDRFLTSYNNFFTELSRATNHSLDAISDSMNGFVEVSRNRDNNNLEEDNTDMLRITTIYQSMMYLQLI